MSRRRLATVCQKTERTMSGLFGSGPKEEADADSKCPVCTIDLAPGRPYCPGCGSRLDQLDNANACPKCSAPMYAVRQPRPARNRIRIAHRTWRPAPLELSTWDKRWPYRVDRGESRIPGNTAALERDRSCIWGTWRPRQHLLLGPIQTDRSLCSQSSGITWRAAFWAPLGRANRQAI